MRIVLDTNCLLASVPPKSPFYWLYEAFEKELFDWVISNETLTEYEEKLSEFYSPKTAQLVLSILIVAPNTIFAEPFFRWQLIEQDPDDNKFVDLAIAGHADFLVTNDAHFNPLKKLDFPKIEVVSLLEFKEILKP
jgi:putative PIN family toxin of toxin-antitoxin system